MWSTKLEKEVYIHVYAWKIGAAVSNECALSLETTQVVETLQISIKPE